MKPNIYNVGTVLKTHPRFFGSGRSPVGVKHKLYRLLCSKSSPGEPFSNHVPVLLAEIKSFFQDVELKVYVDGTLGAGGHAAALVKAHPEMEYGLGVDVDPRALRLAKAKIESLKASVNFTVLRGSFGNIPETLAQHAGPGGLGSSGVDGMLLDVGASSMQLDNPDRGFSFLTDGPLDMRMNTDAPLRAQDVVNTYSEHDLGEMIRDYGEEKQWRQVAKRICEARELKPIVTTRQLVDVIGDTHIYGRTSRRKASTPRNKLHPATRTFQALRITVNKELATLTEAIPKMIECLRPGGRIGVISFHSLEDRIVKKAFMKAAGKVPLSDFAYEEDLNFHSYEEFKVHSTSMSDKKVKLLTRRPVLPTEDEINSNPRSRSAKLRFVEKL